jgi:hypothetical protein
VADPLAPNTTGYIVCPAGTGDAVDRLTANPLPDAVGDAVAVSGEPQQTTYTITAAPLKRARTASLAAMAALAGFAGVVPGRWGGRFPRSSRGNKYRGDNSVDAAGDSKPTRKLKGSLRNRPCPKCGRKMKVCVCGLSPAPAARKVGGE